MPESAEPSAPVAAATPPVFSEARYQDAIALVRNPKRTSTGLILVLSLAAFVVLQADRSVKGVAILVGVILFHELGHYAGMRLFRYGDVRMFFIPFFGAAVSGRRRGAAAWKEGVVLLLGPMPGIILAFVLARHGLTAAADGPALWREVAISLVSINAFNLLPLGGLDGAQLLQQVLFSRRRWMQIGFQLCAALAMGAFALAGSSIALGLLTYFMLMGLPYRWRLLGQARKLRESGAALPLDARELTDDAGRPVFNAALEVTTNRDARHLAVAMEALVDATNARPPRLAASLALGFTWIAGLVFTMITLALVYGPPPEANSGFLPPPMQPGQKVPLTLPIETPRLKLGGSGEFQLRPPGAAQP